MHQNENSRRFIRPARVRQLIEQFIQKVTTKHGMPFDISNVNIKKYQLEKEDLDLLKKAKQQANKVIHIPNAAEIALTIYEINDDDGLQNTLRRIFIAVFEYDPFSFLNDSFY